MADASVGPFVATGPNPDYNYAWNIQSPTTGMAIGQKTTVTSVPGSLSQSGASAVNTASQDLTSTLANYTTDTGQASADTIQAEAYGNEADAYTSAMAAYSGVASAYTTVAGTYQTAAEQAGNSATLEAAAGQLQEYQEALQSQTTIGTQLSNTAGSGFGIGGSALSLLRQSNRQAALTQALTGLQTNINVAGYQEQALGAQGQSEAATGQAAQATAQEAAVGAQATAAQGAATAATASAASATQSANFNKALATNDAAQLAQIEGGLSSGAQALDLTANAHGGTPTAPASDNVLNTAAIAFQAAGVAPPTSSSTAPSAPQSIPSGQLLPTPVTPSAPGSVPLPAA